MAPIDIIANAIRAGDSGHPAPVALAELAADALTDDRIVDHAVQALKADRWGQARPSDLGINDAALRNIARTVLRSVGA